MGTKLRFRHLPCLAVSSSRDIVKRVLDAPHILEKRIVSSMSTILWKHTPHRILVFSRSTSGKDTIVQL